VCDIPSSLAEYCCPESKYVVPNKKKKKKKQKLH